MVLLQRDTALHHGCL